MWNIRNRQQKTPHPLVQRRHLFIIRLDLLGDLFHPSQEFESLAHSGVGAFFGNAGPALSALAQPRDFLVGLVALGLHPLGRRDDLPPLRVQLPKRPQIKRNPAILRHLLDRIHVLPHKSQVMHK
jgi:hypothetical protein